MPRTSFKVSKNKAIVAYVTRHESFHNLTIECQDLRCAFLIQIQGEPKVKVSDWVTFEGVVRMDPGLKANGDPRESNLKYIHDPIDGSDRSSWLFFDMINPEVKVCPDPKLYRCIEECIRRLGSHISDWENNRSRAEISRTISALETTMGELSHVYETKLHIERGDEVKAVVLDIEI